MLHGMVCCDVMLEICTGMVCCDVMLEICTESRTHLRIAQFAPRNDWNQTMEHQTREHILGRNHGEQEPRPKHVKEHSSLAMEPKAV